MCYSLILPGAKRQCEREVSSPRTKKPLSTQPLFKPCPFDLESMILNNCRVGLCLPPTWSLGQILNFFPLNLYVCEYNIGVRQLPFCAVYCFLFFHVIFTNDALILHFLNWIFLVYAWWTSSDWWRTALPLPWKRWSHLCGWTLAELGAKRRSESLDWQLIESLSFFTL